MAETQQKQRKPLDPIFLLQVEGVHDHSALDSVSSNTSSQLPGAGAGLIEGQA